MNDLIAKQIVDLTNVTKEGILGAFNIIEQQAPELVHQLLNWKILSKICNLIIIIPLFYFTLKCIYNSSVNLKKIWLEDTYEDNPFDTLIIILGTVMSIILVIILISTFNSLLQLIFAPKVYVLEYIKNLVQ